MEVWYMFPIIVFIFHNGQPCEASKKCYKCDGLECLQVDSIWVSYGDKMNSKFTVVWCESFWFMMMELKPDV